MTALLRSVAVRPLVAGLLTLGWLAGVVQAQSVCLPAPRLLTTMPMGGRAGAEIDVTITGEHADDAEELRFSDPRITATPKMGADGKPVPMQFVVRIAADCPAGLHEARLMTRLGLSSSRVFSVSALPETTRTAPNTTLATAMDLQVNSICNAVMSVRTADHYRFEAKQGQRILVDCATRGIDSKLDAVLIVADEAGRDLVAERRGGAIDFTVPKDGRYVVKVHDLTYQGGPAFFYRLVLQELAPGAPIVRHPSTKPVNSASWPPAGLPEEAKTAETEPNNGGAQAQKITLPCDIAGSFFPAADVDVYEFEATKGDVWWVEVGSERLGRPTDASVLVQRVVPQGDSETLADVAELSDIPSPVKVSSNGYAYDGPPYNVGSSDVLGKLTIPETGRYRLQISDLFGGTRSDPRNIYRLVIRRAEPDFALVAWALHMELRNGDRNALSKPISLRGGATMALEVVAIRRDGFDGEIELSMENLPEGMSARGLKIPAGQSRGVMLVTAAEGTARAVGSARFVGRANINGQEIVRPCHLASFAWPIPDSWGEIPRPRLLADVPVSVGGSDQAPLTIAPVSSVFPAPAGSQLKIPLRLTRRSEFSGATMQLRTVGAVFERVPQFNLSLTSDEAEAVVDLATLKPAPGDYVIAFYGGAVAKYRHRPEAVAAAEEEKKSAEERLKAAEAEAKQLAEAAKSAPAEKKAEAEKASQAAEAGQKAAAAAVTAATEKLKQATQTAQPKDIVDIVVSEPITIRVLPAENK